MTMRKMNFRRESDFLSAINTVHAETETPAAAALVQMFNINQKWCGSVLSEKTQLTGGDVMSRAAA